MLVYDTPQASPRDGRLRHRCPLWAGPCSATAAARPPPRTCCCRSSRPAHSNSTSTVQVLASPESPGCRATPSATFLGTRHKVVSEPLAPIQPTVRCTLCLTVVPRWPPDHTVSPLQWFFVLIQPHTRYTGTVLQHQPRPSARTRTSHRIQATCESYVQVCRKLPHTGMPYACSQVQRRRARR